MPNYDARSIANFFLDYAKTKDVSVTNMSLLKIIYFAHGWHLKTYGTPLVKNTFEAWERGPVIKVVYDCFKQNRSSPIKSRAQVFSVETGGYIDAIYDLDESLEQFLKKIFDFYSKFDAFTLSELTHEAGSPWHTVMKESNRNICLQLEIPKNIIKEYFSKRMNA